MNVYVLCPLLLHVTKTRIGEEKTDHPGPLREPSTVGDANDLGHNISY